MDYRHLPLISGLLIAFSLFLNFFATTNNTWLLKTYPPVDEYKNNFFMQFLLWITLFISVANTICLFMRLFEKSLIKATKLCILLCLSQGAMLVVIVLLFAYFNPLKEELEYSEGFFSAIQASCICFLSASFLFFDKTTTVDFETKGSGFSRVQRKLVILVSIAILYVSIGTYIFMQMEPWSSKESMFFIITTLTTIGFGNRAPKNDHSRLFIIIYSIGGMGILAYTVSVISEVLKENVMVSFQTQLTMFREKRYERIICDTDKGSNGDAILNFNEFDDEEEEKKIVLNDQKQMAKKQFLSAIVLIIFSWAAGACTFYYTEGWSMIEAIYFCFISFSTIGFGDLVPTTSSSLSIFNIWIILEIATMTFLVSAATNYVEIKWADSIDSKDENNELEDALDIIRGKHKKRKISFGEKKAIRNDENIQMAVLNTPEQNENVRQRNTNREELEEWEDATESFETILNNTVKINNAMKILQTNINILKEGYYKNYKTDNSSGNIPTNSLDATIERTLKIIEESCKTIKTISIGEDDETEKVESNATEEDNRKVIFGNEDEQTLIMHSREPTSYN
ncbi:voltage-gated potassium channel [Anaeromyces robustus]|uniref:Voltage-gated potassium channel n=1 Tax=Anaeromyces robustus TaxID=1754192 RepID=A0A1Y1WGB5_9FUNG|nr:voltage-gated potassium channel [Anaeromyces robustus]|eukprot:ORX72590.1 voltage-gated potassium channel [Anaeromyces robustus]